MKLLGQLLAIVLFIFILWLIWILGYSIFTQWDKVFQSLLNNISIFGAILGATITYLLNEKSKRKEWQQQERNKQKLDVMQVYQNYLNNQFYIMRDKDFSPTNEHVLESRRILQSQLPLFVPDDVLRQMAKMQENARQLYFHQMKGSGDLFSNLEKETLGQMNKLIELMRKDLLPTTSITDNDIESLLSTSFEFLQFVREQEQKKEGIPHGT